MDDQYARWLESLADTKEKTDKCNPCPKALRRAAAQIRSLHTERSDLVMVLEQLLTYPNGEIERLAAEEVLKNIAQVGEKQGG